jgi:ornithine carbamoyltransferase
MQLARGESIFDTAKVLERYIDAFVARVFSHTTLDEMAGFTSIPVINALSDLEHPCQILADFTTILEHKKRLHDLKIVYVGDGNNVATSLLFASAILGCHFVAASPDEFSLPDEVFKQAQHYAVASGAVLEKVVDPQVAVQQADILYTDTWISMGDSDEKRHKLSSFLPYQINTSLLSLAKSDCLVMHCLPAHRGEEITDEVMDGDASIIWDQAEYRLHAQKALFVSIFS